MIQKRRNGLFSKIKNFFNRPKALPSPSEYTMDDWINDQKGPFSRMFSKIISSTTNAVQNIISKSEAKRNENINTPSTPSQNFEMPPVLGNDNIAPSAPIIIPNVKSNASRETTMVNKSKPFVPLKVETIDTAEVDEVLKGEDNKVPLDNKDVVAEDKNKNEVIQPQQPKMNETSTASKDDDLEI